MSNVLSGDHDSLNNLVNFFATLTNKSGASGVSGGPNGFAELLQNLLGGKNVISTNTNNNVVNTAIATTAASTSTATKNTQSTAKKVSLNDPNAAFVATGGMVTVTIQNSNSDYKNRIFWSTDNFKTRHYIGVDNKIGNHNIGIFPAGTRIEFAIDNGAGGFFRTGPAAKNPDNVVHALVTKSKGTSTIRFEDMYGGGDGNFADAIIRVQNKPAPKPQSGGVSSTTTTTTNTNNDVSNVGWWPIINPGNQTISTDSVLNWLNSSFPDPDDSNMQDQKCSDLFLYLLMQIRNKKQSFVESTYIDDSLIQPLKKEGVISSVDVKWLAALNNK